VGGVGGEGVGEGGWGGRAAEKIVGKSSVQNVRPITFQNITLP